MLIRQHNKKFSQKTNIWRMTIIKYFSYLIP